MFRFHKGYLLLTILLFITEVLIALFLHDRFIRPYVGDFLVVMLLYCCCKSFVEAPLIPLCMGVLLFAYLIELSQYFRLVERLGWQDSALARTIIGSSFEWVDLLAYTLGVVAVIVVERYRQSRQGIWPDKVVAGSH